MTINDKGVDIKDIIEIIKNSGSQFIADMAEKLVQYRKAGEWDQFISLVGAVPELIPEAFMYYEQIPDRLKYDFVVDMYQHRGDSVPDVRKAVRGLRKYGRPTLPEWMAKAEYVTIYRAGEEPINLAKYRISWTTDLDKARWFLARWNGCHARYLYKGKIRPERIIAYSDDRKESEVMQYANVFDITEL